MLFRECDCLDGIGHPVATLHIVLNLSEDVRAR